MDRVLIGEDVSSGYGNVTIVHGVNLEVGRGEIVA
ncbi:MAG: ABC transporter ATP-binding protein, partial [Euryarchaeota archaeon]|nr:ABC transporter ATP-binding protein [Euryarchaeota archaeon]